MWLRFPPVSGAKGKSILNYSCFSSIGTDLWFSSRVFNPNPCICRTADLGMLWGWSESKNAVLQKCWRFWNWFFAFLWQNTPFRKSFQSQRCLNSVFSTFTHHVTDPLQVLASINPNISLAFPLYLHWRKGILTWAERFVHCMSLLDGSNPQIKYSSLLSFSCLIKTFCHEV